MTSAWQQKNPDRYRAYQREYMKLYRKRKPRKRTIASRTAARNWWIRHPDYNKQRYADPLKRAAILVTRAKRRAVKRKAMPSWLSKNQHQKITALYQQGVLLNMHVNHICPLTAFILIEGRRTHIACGLHVPWNLELLSRKENLNRSAKLLSDVENGTYKESLYRALRMS